MMKSRGLLLLCAAIIAVFVVLAKTSSSNASKKGADENSLDEIDDDLAMAMATARELNVSSTALPPVPGKIEQEVENAMHENLTMSDTVDKPMPKEFWKDITGLAGMMPKPNVKTKDVDPKHLQQVAKLEKIQLEEAKTETNHHEVVSKAMEQLVSKMQHRQDKLQQTLEKEGKENSNKGGGGE